MALAQQPCHIDAPRLCLCRLCGPCVNLLRDKWGRGGGKDCRRAPSLLPTATPHPSPAQPNVFNGEDANILSLFVTLQTFREAQLLRVVSHIKGCHAKQEHARKLLCRT